MNLLRKFAKLDGSKRRLLARAVVWIVIVRVGLRVLPYRTLSPLLDRMARPATVGAFCSPAEVRWALAAAARRLPGTRCLAWALACRSLLRQAGFASELQFGVAKDRKGRLQAHAWVECRGMPLSWGDDERSYAPLASVLRGDR